MRDNIVHNTCSFSKTLFDAHPEDPDYMPPPEDRPGGFNWGQEANVQ